MTTPEVPDATTEETTNMEVSQIITFWKPGSKDENWTWADEYAELIPQPRTAQLAAKQNFPGHNAEMDPYPILLGSDGRVWDGHHRICIAIFSGTHTLPVRIITEGDNQ